MPMPKVKDGESKKDFLSRCMGDDIMLKDYPKQDQRYAICNDLWNKKDSGSIDFASIKRPIIETRSYPFEVSEIRTLEDNTIKITGYAGVYNQLSGDLGGFKEIIKRGFFKPAIGRDDVRALINHDDNLVLGRNNPQSNKPPTLLLEEDKNGLKIEIFPANTTYENDLITHMKRGDVDQMSFQWMTEKDEWDSSDMNNIVRTLIEIKSLWDVSVVTFPAYPQAKAEANSAKQVFMNYLEKWLEENPDKEEEIETNNIEWQERISIMRKRLILLDKEN